MAAGETGAPCSPNGADPVGDYRKDDKDCEGAQA